MPIREKGPKTQASRKSSQKALGLPDAGESSSSTGSRRSSTTPESTSDTSSSRTRQGKRPSTGSEQPSTTPESTSAASSSRIRQRKRQLESDNDDSQPARRTVRPRILRSNTPDRPTPPRESALDDIFEPRQQERDLIHHVLLTDPSFPLPLPYYLRVPAPSSQVPFPSHSPSVHVHVPSESPPHLPYSPTLQVPSHPLPSSLSPAVPANTASSKRPGSPIDPAPKQRRKKAKIVDPEVAEARRIANNQAAADRRRSPASTYQTEALPERRLASAQAKKEPITDYITSPFSELANAHRATFAVLETEYETSLEKLQHFFNAYRRSHCLTEIPAEHRFWLSMSEESADFLLSVAVNPLSWRPDQYTQSGFVQKQHANQLPPRRSGPLQAQTYIRRLDDVSWDEFFTYMKNCPADIPDTLFTCIQSAIPLEEIRNQVTQFADGHDFGPAILCALDIIEETCLDSLPLFPTTTIALHYGGHTISSTPYQRMKDDHHSEHRRLTNWENVNRQFEDVYYIPSLDYPVDNALEERTDEVVSLLEEITICCLGQVGKNRQHSGCFPNFEPPHDAVECADATLDPFPPIQQHLPPMPQKEINFYRKSFHREREFFSEVDPSTPTMDADSFESMLVNGVDSIRRVLGTTLDMSLLKGPTIEDMSGSVGGIRDETAGQAMREAHHLISILGTEARKDQAVPKGELAAQDILPFFGPAVDCFRFFLCIQHVLWCLAFLSRFFSTTQPAFVKVFSAIVGHYVFDDYLYLMWQPPLKAHPELVQDFFDGHVSLEMMEMILPYDPSIEQRRQVWSYERFTSMLGKLQIICYGPKPEHCTIGLSPHHDGMLSTPRKLLQFLLYTKAELVNHIPEIG